MPEGDEQPVTERDRVEDWRELQLLKAGYPGAAAIALSRRQDIDVHVAVGLLTHGCPLAIALDILH